MAWRFLDNGVNAVETVEVGLFSAGAGTAVTLVHELDDLAGEGDDIRQDWMDALTRLSAPVRLIQGTRVSGRPLLSATARRPLPPAERPPATAWRPASIRPTA